MITQAEANTRVARGAAYLDQVRPGWQDRIDVGTLTLHDPCGCIVGQLCPMKEPLCRFTRGLEALGMVYKPYGQAATLGLDLRMEELSDQDPREQAFAPLQNAWIQEIAQRRFPVSEAAPSETRQAVRA